MKPMTMLFRPALLAALAAHACAPGLSSAVTFSADLTLAQTAGPRGEYLTASYDFGVAFREVHSVTLAINMPDGYQGTAMTTGNSSLHRSLSIQIHDPADQPPVEYLSQYLGTSAFDVPRGSMDFLMSRLLLNAGGSTTLADWPTFLPSGSGNVSFIDVATSYSHALPDGAGSSSTTTWAPPTGIAGARLTIDATVVPEPCAAAIALIGVVAYISHGKRRDDSSPCDFGPI